MKTGGTECTTTSTTTTAPPYDFYLANQYDCNNPNGCNYVEAVDVPVCFPTGTSYIATHYYNDISLDGKLYKITSSTTSQIAVILDATAPHGTNCNVICAV